LPREQPLYGSTIGLFARISAQNLFLLALQRLEGQEVSRETLARAIHRAGLALELALAGPSTWKHAQKALPTERVSTFRQQLETLLDLLNLSGLAVDDLNYRRELREELRSARQSGLWTIEADDEAITDDATGQSLEEASQMFADRGFHRLADLIGLQAPDGAAVVAGMVEYFLRRSLCQAASGNDPGVWRCLEVTANLLDHHGAELESLLDTSPDTSVTDIAEGNAAAVERLFQLGLSRHLAGEYRQAADHFTAALKLAPTDARLYAYRGDAFRMECEYERAITDFHRSLSANADNPAVLVSRASAYHLNGEHQRAVEDCTAALELRPDHAAAYRTRAAALAELHLSDQALADLGQALALAGEDDGARYQRGLIYVDRRDFSLAVVDFDRVLDGNPHHVPARLQRGHAHRGRGDYTGAILDYSEVLRHHADNVPAYVGRALAYRLKGDPDRAIGDYTEALRRDPDNARAWYGRGVLHRGKGDLEGALADLDEAIPRAPENWGARYHRGKVLLALNRFDVALDDLTETLYLNPRLVVAYLSRALLHAQAARHDESIDDASRAIELATDSAAARLVRGVLYSHATDFASAIDDLTEAIHLDEQLALAYQERGLAFTLLGKPEQALADCNQLIALEPGNARAYANRSIAWHLQGELQRALEDYSRALRLDPRCILNGCNPGLTTDARLQTTRALADFVDGLRPKSSRSRVRPALEFRIELRPVDSKQTIPDSVLEETPKRRAPKPPVETTTTVAEDQPAVETVALAPEAIAPASEPEPIDFEEPAEEEIGFEEVAEEKDVPDANEADTDAVTVALDELLAEESASPAAIEFTEAPEPAEPQSLPVEPEPERARAPAPPPPPAAPRRPSRPRPERPVRRPTRNDDDEGFLQQWKKPIFSLAATMAAVLLLWFWLPANLFGSDHLHVYPSRGQISFDEQPLAGANIVLTPAWTDEPNFPRPHAVAAEDGSFTIATYGKEDGAPAGEYKVMVTWFQKTRETDGEGSPLQKNLLPVRYGKFTTSGLTLRVTEGENRNLVLNLTR
jgi:tetratricopeptide (TPR) repeat protein